MDAINSLLAKGRDAVLTVQTISASRSTARANQSKRNAPGGRRLGVWPAGIHTLPPPGFHPPRNSPSPEAQSVRRGSPQNRRAALPAFHNAKHHPQAPSCPARRSWPLAPRKLVPRGSGLGVSSSRPQLLASGNLRHDMPVVLTSYHIIPKDLLVPLPPYSVFMSSGRRLDECRIHPADDYSLTTPGSGGPQHRPWADPGDMPRT